jgi:PTH1 family peptidyl-tRNA hydrolase
LVVGLGNPGAEYRRTRHNVGFDVVECLARRAGADAFRPQKKNLLARARLAGEDCLFALPQTYMNLSGEAVGPLVRFYKLPPQRVLVVHDELDFAVGHVRFKQRGGHGGHNGLRSLLAHLPDDFVRLRVGIGALGARARQTDFVLGRFRPDEQPAVDESIAAAARALEVAIGQGLEAAMREYHGRP